jgi:hypothetical protein
MNSIEVESLGSATLALELKHKNVFITEPTQLEAFNEETSISSPAIELNHKSRRSIANVIAESFICKSNA